MNCNTLGTQTINKLQEQRKIQSLEFKEKLDTEWTSFENCVQEMANRFGTGFWGGGEYVVRLRKG
jgi:hypothetical protein